MKLFSPKEIEKKRRDQEAVAVMRGARIAGLIDLESKKLNTVKETVSKGITKAEEDFSQFVSERTQKIAELEQETEELEDRKKKALEPITEEYQKLEIKQQELSHRATELSQIEVNLLNERNTVQVYKAQLEANLRASEKDREEVERLLREAIAQKRESNKVLKKADRESSRILIESTNKLHGIVERERCADNTKILYEHKLKLLDDKEKYLSNQEKKLESERAALDAVFNEARKKGII